MSKKLKKNIEYFRRSDDISEEVQKELDLGLDLLNTIDNPIVSILGSHKVKKNNKYYKHCYTLAQKLGKENYAILTGGGPGIMEAANSGAFKVGGTSIGLQAALLTKEQVSNANFTLRMGLKYLFVRRFLLGIKSEALIFYPGGFGTLNELFEYLVLIQTKILDEVPIVCVNKSYWDGLFKWLKKCIGEKGLLTNKGDLNLLQFAEDVDEVIKLIKS